MTKTQAPIQSKQKEMIKDAVDILEFYAGLSEESLADESVINCLLDDYGLSITDAHRVLHLAYTSREKD